MEPTPCQPSDAWNFKLGPRFLENLRALGLGFGIWTVKPSLQIAYLATRFFFFKVSYSYGLWFVEMAVWVWGPLSVQFFELQYVSDIWQSPILERSPCATAVSVYYISSFDIFCIEVFPAKVRSCLSQIFWKFYCFIIDCSEPELSGPQSVINSSSFM